MDKASNNLMAACDNIKQSCIGYSKRVFIVESIGGLCGFQSLFGAIVSGAEQFFIPERSPKLEQMNELVSVMRQRFTQTEAQMGLVINSENASALYSSAFIRDLHQNALADLKVSSRMANLAGIQQGGDPSPMDRIFSGRMALSAVEHLNHCCRDKRVESVFCGLVDDLPLTTPLSEFARMVDHMNRRPLKQPWLDLLVPAFKAVSFPPVAAKAKL